MSKINVKFSPGSITEQVTSSKLNEIVSAVNRNQITRVVGGSFRQGENGTTIVVQPGVAGVSGVVDVNPFTISAKYDANRNQVYYSVSLGVINNYIPEILDDKDGYIEIDSETERKTQPQKYIPGSSSYSRQVYVEINYNTATVRIEDYASWQPSPYDPAGIGRVSLGNINLNGTTKAVSVQQFVRGNLFLYPYKEAEFAFVNEY